jgi:uncharacterized protein YjdB
MKRIASFLALILFSAFTFAGSIGAPTNIDFGTYSIKGLSEVTDSVELTLSPSGISEYGIGVEVVDDAEGIFWASDSWLRPNGTPDYYGVKKAKVYFYAIEKGTFTAKLRLTDYDTEAYEDVQLKVVITDEAIVPKTIPFERIETTSGLKDGDTIVFVSESAGAVCGPLNGTYLPAVTEGVTIDATNHKAEIPETGVQMFRAAKYSGNWQFIYPDDNEKALLLDYSSNSGKGAFSTTYEVGKTVKSWEISISNGVASVIRPNDADPAYPVRFNSDRFKPYKTEATGTSFAIYKKAGAAAEIKSKLEIGAIDFGSVELNETKEVTVNYTAENLTEDILWDITGADKTLFSVSPEQSTDRTSGSVTVKYLGTASAVKAIDAKLYALTQDAALDPMEKEVPISITLTASTIKLTKIEFVGAPDSLVKGTSIDLKPYLVLTPDNAADKSLTWTVDKSYQGTVEDGVYTAKNVTGNVTITATSVKVPSVSASITLMQYEPKPASITLDKHEITTYIGEVVTLQGTVGPEGASQDCYFTIRNKDILTYSKGDVTGSAKLTAKALCPEGTWVVVNPKNYQTILDSCLVKVVPVSVEGVAFDPATKELAVGATYQLEPVVTPAAAASQYTAAYESNNTAVATVDADGKVTAVAEGTAEITCTLGGKSGKITINVVGAKFFTKVTDASKMQAGDTIILMANVGENPLVAGEVNSAKNCLDTILGGILTTDNSVACDRALTLVVGGTTDNFTLTKLGTTSTLATSDNTKLGYSTSKNKWKFVAGTAGVMLTNASFNEKNICYNSQSKYIRMYAVGTTSTPLYVYVRPYAEPVKPAATGISLDQTSYETHVGDKDITLKATVTPSDADQAVIWESSNTAVATVNASGKVHPVSVGTAVITAKVKSNEDLKAECTVNVLAWTVEYVEFDITGDLNLEVGEQETVTATAYPTGHGFKVDYYTSDENIATVTIGGVVTGVAAGDAVITAKSGDKEAKLNVHVTVAPVPEDKGAISVADFLAAKDGFNIYTLTGVVANITNTKYGNFDLIDETGKIYIYGLLNAAGEAQKFAELNVAEKDTVTLKGSYSEHNNKEQIKDALFVSVKKYVEPVGPSTAIDAAMKQGQATKVLRQGQLIIIRDDKEYNAVGKRVK